MPLPLLAIFGASLVIGTLVVVALLKWREIVNWFRNKGALKQSDKDNIAVMVKTQLQRVMFAKFTVFSTPEPKRFLMDSNMKPKNLTRNCKMFSVKKMLSFYLKR